MNSLLSRAAPALFALAPIALRAAPDAAPPHFLSADGYASVQEAIDRNPGRMVFLPPGDYFIDQSILLASAGSGLYGPGRIIQRNPEAVIVTARGAANIEIRDVTLTRSEGKMDSTTDAILGEQCEGLEISDVRIFDNRSQRPGILLQQCGHPVVKNCTIRNYMRLGVDNRLKSMDWGFAFNVIDGTGMDIRECTGALIQSNRVLEDRLKPTPEIKQQYHLGDFIKMNPVKGILVSSQMWAEKYYNAWHQGAAIHVAQGRFGDCTQLIGNYIENAAQGMDLQSDHIIMAQNIINNAFIGMKAMHGARNVSIVGNQFTRNDLWAIGLMPGANSHAAGEPTARFPEANVDGHSIIANNIISDFGYGTAYWMWKDNHMSAYAIRLEKGQKPINPPLTDVVIEGNVIYDTGSDKILVDGKPQVAPPRYKYAVFVTPEGSSPNPTPRGLHFSNNIFQTGTAGVSNLPLNP